MEFDWHLFKCSFLFSDEGGRSEDDNENDISSERKVPPSLTVGSCIGATNGVAGGLSSNVSSGAVATVTAPTSNSKDHHMPAAVPCSHSNYMNLSRLVIFININLVIYV